MCNKTTQSNEITNHQKGVKRKRDERIKDLRISGKTN